MSRSSTSASLGRAFLESEASAGILLFLAAAAALVVANSPLAPAYFAALHTYLGPLSLSHWINDGLMAIFFLLVGLEIKREFVEGQLNTWPRRTLPGICAAGGMLVPALIFVAFNRNDPETLRGWAIPTATDIAFALGVLSLFGRRVPASLKVFLTALAIIDDLGAVLIIALFYTSDLNLAAFGGAVGVTIVLAGMSRAGVRSLWPYLALGAVLWVLVLQSGIHATVAGVVLAMTIPIRPDAQNADKNPSPLHRLEHALQRSVAFLVVPLFGFANAGVSFAGVTSDQFVSPPTLGVAVGLIVGKLAGVYLTASLSIRSGLAQPPQGASGLHLIGISLLCGIGFTMSLFIGLLAFPDAARLQEDVKIGILLGSCVAAAFGSAVLFAASKRASAPKR